MTVSGNIEFGLKARGTPRSERAKRAADALALVDMSGYGARKPSELSGGQRQRVALARALVLEPALLLMDEPLSSLDSDLKRRLTDEILSLHGKLGFAMVYVTHDRDEAMRLASRVVVMERGRVEFDGTPDNAFSGR
jgi:ABC-type Fe3+/spermidine/putrescine transport system ATPase subunit